MEQSPHVMMIGEGAENFAFAHGMERVSPEIFSTPLRYEQTNGSARGRGNSPRP
ncbi:putative L-asparaginase [Escherichia coli]|nr:putative L-asparaginase [Escherichia coli]